MTGSTEFTNMKLIDATGLAAELGVSRWWTMSAKRAGAWQGRFTTLEEFKEWRKANQGFVAARQWRRSQSGSAIAATASPTSSTPSRV
jgi:hypothetical protein